MAGQLRAMVVDLTAALPSPPAIRIAGPADGLREDLVTNQFAVLYEALTNVVRHARAHTAAVDITVASGTVTLQVEDDGIGMDGAPRHGGLADLHRRATWHGGTLSVEPAIPGGTRLTWSAPESRRSARAEKVPRADSRGTPTERPAAVSGWSPTSPRGRSDPDDARPAL